MTNAFKRIGKYLSSERSSSKQLDLIREHAIKFEQLEIRNLLTGFGSEPFYGVTVTPDIVYRDDAEVGYGTPGGVTTKELKLDLYEPVGPGLPQELPAAIIVHGGGFTGGDKASNNFVRLADDFASRGYVTVSINYRLLGDNVPPALPNDPWDQSPIYHTIIAGIEDTFHAIDWMKDSAVDLNVDPDRIVLAGHSAGGFLAMYGGMIDPQDITQVSDMALDISDLDVAAVFDGAGSIVGFEQTINPDDPPVFIAHAEDDTVVLFENAQTIAGLLDANQIDYEFPVIPNAGHGLNSKLDFVIDGETVRQSMFDFYQQQLNLEELLAPNTTKSIQSGSWFDPATWDNGIPHFFSRAIISAGQTVTLDGVDHLADEIVVHGVLDVSEPAAGSNLTRSLQADWIHVNSGGVFQVGSEADRFDDGRFVLTLTGTDISADHMIETATGMMIGVQDNDGFLMTASGGRLQFFGADKPTFTKLAATVEPGARQIRVESLIERNFDGTTSAASDGRINWAVGDQIVIASSSYDYAEQEVRVITAIATSGDQLTITLDAPLDFRHYGEIETYGNGTRDWDIDMRAEVALLNRTIKVQGTQDTDDLFGDRENYGTNPGQNLGIGGHAMFMPWSGQITLDSVRFDKMGQTATIGRYPVHWHVAGDRTGDILRNSSITNSNNRGVTIHGTQGVLVQGNVLHDIHGHGFFLEDAAETNNQFLHNITFGIHRVGGNVGSTDPFIVPGITRGADGRVNGTAVQGDNSESSHDTGQQAPERFVHSAAYWITNPDNTWVGNISAGSEGTGFWFALPSRVLGLSKDTGLYDNLNPRTTNLGQFDHNTSHASQIGLTFDRGSDIMGFETTNGFNPSQIPQINFFTGYKHYGTAVYQRANLTIFNESRFADNNFSSFNTFRQEEHNVLFVGHSRGNADPTLTMGGYRLYDGPGRIVNSHFAGFGLSTAHAFRIEGGANKFSHTQAVGLTFEDDGTADRLGIDLYGDSAISLDQSPTFLAGRPDSFAGLVYDVDGSLTSHGGGGPGYVLTPKVDFYRDSTDIMPENWDGYLSDDRFAQFRIGRLTDVSDNGNYIPTFRITNGDGHSIVADRWNQTHVQRTYVKLNAGHYTVEFLNDKPTDGFDVVLQVRSVNQPGDHTIFRYVDIARNYQPTSGLEVTRQEDLLKATETSWYRDPQGDLWMKIFQSEQTIRIEAKDPIIVTNTNDSGPGSLRDAIIMANNTPGLDNIVFDIGNDGSSQSIQVLTPLPEITDRVYLDGLSQTIKPIREGGFEIPIQPDNTWKLANGSGDGSLVGSEWNFTGGAGITRNISAVQISASTVFTGFVPAPEGQQHGVISNYGTMSQSITGFEVGKEYELGLYAMARQLYIYNGGSLTITLDEGLSTELVLFELPEITSSWFTKFTTDRFVAAKPSYTLTIESDPVGNGLRGDRATFVDNIHFRQTTPTVVIDGSESSGSGFRVVAGGSNLRWMAIHDFSSGAGIHIYGAGDNAVDHVWVGVDGSELKPNLYGIGIQSESNRVTNSTIGGNMVAGIATLGDQADGNTFAKNSIFSNEGLGIDLENDGVTLNDDLDADSGSNELTNFPVITRAINYSGVTWLIGYVAAEPNTEYQIEVFANSSLHPSGYGEGQKYLASEKITTFESGTGYFTFRLEGVDVGQYITTTSTDPSGNTSEFSAGFEITEINRGRRRDQPRGSNKPDKVLAVRQIPKTTHPKRDARLSQSEGKFASSKSDLISTLTVSNSISQKTYTAKQWDKSHALFSKTPQIEEHVDKKKMANHLESIHHKVFEELEWDFL